MSPSDDIMIEDALSTLASRVSFDAAADGIYQLLDRFGSQLITMPHLQRHLVTSTLLGGHFGAMFEDIPVHRQTNDTPLCRLYYGLSRIFPATRIDTPADCQKAAIPVLTRLKERNASLGWQMVHPRIDHSPGVPLTKQLIHDAFVLQTSIGQTERVSDPVIFSLDYPVVCLLQNLHIDRFGMLRQQTFSSVVPSGFLRLTVLPNYLIGSSGLDSLVWLQKGFIIRIGGFRLPMKATALHDIGWLLTDNRLRRCVAYDNQSGAVMTHNERVLTR